MSGWLRVIGLGPGPDSWITAETREVLAAATDFVGYAPYLARLTLSSGQRAHASDNREELSRASMALGLCAEGARVAVVSGGDPGVFAMAAAVFEAIDQGPAALASLDVRVLPGVTAMLAAAARLGAPLGNDFCAINLSDNLKPWSIIARRLKLAAEADFAIALYNPASRARAEQVHEAFALLRQALPAERLVVFAQAVGRPDEHVMVTTLGDADPSLADMRTLLLICASTTRRIERPGQAPWLYASRRL